MKKKLKIEMIQKDISIEDLAKEVNISVVQLSKVINGKSDGSVTLWRKLATSLSCKIGDIIE